MTTRRDVLRFIPLAGCAAAAPFVASALADRSHSAGITHKVAMTLSRAIQGPLLPLDHLGVESPVSGRVVVRDGDQQIYLDVPVERSVEIVLGGALGTHSISLLSLDGSLLDFRTFFVDCKTRIDDDGRLFGSLLKDLYWTMATDGPVTAMRYKDEVFTCWDSWLQDNTNTLKGMKYFWPEVKSNVDFYANSQREDGMIWENFESRTPPESDWDRRFKYANFTRSAEGGFLELRRAPVENHVEHFFLEAIYFSWKASGDTPWMAGKLDAAIRAVHYATSDPYRWSTKYQLLKRGFTIDTWDFLCDSEAKLVDDDIMKVDLKKTHFGVFFGDNANLIAGLRRLAEMLVVAGRGADAPQFLSMADGLEKRLNEVSWNGEFFMHWVPEDRSLKFDMGVDIYRQVALSNAYSLNRGITHEQCVAIIKTYQRIRTEMPSSSPGEFYAIYPPFETGFGNEDAKWEYMNGGVMSCTAGELAQGAFENGFEQYGADILRRYKAIADRYGRLVPAILRGKAPEAPKRKLQTVDMRSIVNADFGVGAPGVPGWTGEPGNDLAAMSTGRQTFRDIPFEVIDPATNGHRACLAIAEGPGYKKKETLAINASAQSFYLLHTKGGDDLSGRLTIVYADKTSHSEYIQSGINVSGWWAPHDTEYDTRYGPMVAERMQVAWRGANHKSGNVGVSVVGFPNPYPDKVIEALEFRSVETNAKWMILGVTLSDAPVFLPPWNELSGGMPNNWGAAALVFALVEGLAGVKDTGCGMSKALLSPRWCAAGVKQSDVSVRYPASRGYVRYNYNYDPDSRKLVMSFTGSAIETEVAVLLPQGASVVHTRLDGQDQSVRIESVEGSHYACLKTAKRGTHILELELA